MEFIKSRWKLLVSLFIVLASVLFVTRSESVRFAEIWAAVQRFSIAPILTGLALAVIQVLSQGSRLWSLLPNSSTGSPKWAFVLRSFSLGQLVNNYVPARAGDLVKIAALRGDGGDVSQTATAAGSVLVADKVVDILALVLITIPFTSKLVAEFGMPAAVTGAMNSGWTPVAMASVGAGSLVAGWQLRKRTLQGTLPSWLLNFGRGSSGLLKWNRLAGGLFFSGLSWLSEATIVVILARALGFDLGLAQGVWVLLVLNLGIAIPVSFANIGTFEASMMFGLSRFGVPVPEALAIAVIHHGLQIISVAAAAAIFWIGPWGKKR